MLTLRTALLSLSGGALAALLVLVWPRAVSAVGGGMRAARTARPRGTAAHSGRLRLLGGPFVGFVPTLSGVWRQAIGDGRTPMDRALIAEEPALRGLSGLYWRALFAGYGEHTLLWLRGRQVLLGAVILTGGITATMLLDLPATALLVFAAMAVPGSVVLLRLDLAQQVSTRRRRLSIQFVPFLYNLANLTGNGLSIRDALRDLADPDGGELARELAVVLRLLATGVKLERALRVFACRCHTPEIDTAVNRIITTQATRDRGRTLSSALYDIAEATRTRILNDMRVRSKVENTKTLSIVVLTAMPAMIVAVLAPPGATLWHILMG